MNIYEKNVYKCATIALRRKAPKESNGMPVPYYDYRDNIIDILAKAYSQYQKKIGHRLKFRYLEMPITTRCTLKCKECCNFIQYYKTPYDITYKTICEQIDKITSMSDVIEKLRILGGEPLLHNDLPMIIKKCVESSKIHQVELVTNGTVSLSDEVVSVLKNRKISVYLSNYGELSRKIKINCEILKDNGIPYRVEREQLYWLKLGETYCRNKTIEQLKVDKQRCVAETICLFNGKLYICPKAAHGHDLSIYSAECDEFVDLIEDKKSNKKKVYQLLNRDYFSACNYCDMPRYEELESVISAEQLHMR